MILHHHPFFLVYVYNEDDIQSSWHWLSIITILGCLLSFFVDVMSPRFISRSFFPWTNAFSMHNLVLNPNLEKQIVRKNTIHKTYPILEISMYRCFGNISYIHYYCGFSVHSLDNVLIISCWSDGLYLSTQNFQL